MGFFSKFGFFLLLVANLAVDIVSSAPDVRLVTGIARGVDRRAAGRNRALYYAYYGIPFAEPPVGPLRFQPPVPYRGSGSNQVITSDTFRDACLQAPVGSVPMSEDCLHLNIFTPTTASRNLTKKVMVWIHGGAFLIGSANGYIPSAMVTRSDVIVVTIHYRLDVLGFLSSGDDVMPGNLGLRDQIMALQWVKDNIAQFGGDPNDVTVFGESAGSASVSFLSISPAAKGLFTKAIMQSGTVFSGWAKVSKPETTFYRFAKQMDCAPRFAFPGMSRWYHQTVMTCLMSKQEPLVFDPSFRTETLVEIFGEDSLAPVVDGDLLPNEPYDLLSDKEYLSRVGALSRSYVMGTTNNEGGILAAFGDLGIFNDPINVADLIRGAADSLFPQPVDSTVLNFIDFIYTYPRTSDGNTPTQSIFDLTTDVFYVAPTVLVAKLLREASSETTVYHYVFDHNPPVRNPEFGIQGSIHSIDILYEFDDPETDDEFGLSALYLDDPQKDEVRQEFGGALAEFAKTGRPATAKITWPRFDLNNQLCTSVSAQPRSFEKLNGQRMSMWLEFLPKITKMSLSGRGYRVAFW